MKTRPRDHDEYYDRREKNADEKFCETCGFIVKINSNMCPNCKTALRFLNIQKDKATALILAIFCSFFTWAYIYDKNVVKFWVGATVSSISFIITTYLFFLRIDFWIVGLIPMLAVWLFAVIDISVKTTKYFENEE